MATLHGQLDFPISKSPLGPSNSIICPGNSPKRPSTAPNLCRLAANSHKRRTCHISGYMAQNAIPRAPIPLATRDLLWFPHLKIAQTDA